MKYSYKLKDVCPSMVEFELEDDIVKKQTSCSDQFAKVLQDAALKTNKGE